LGIDEDLRRLVQVPNFAVLATRGPSGHPSAHLTWIDCDEDCLLVNTEMHRQKVRNVQCDPRVAVTVLNRDSAYAFIEARGSVAGLIRGARARDHIDELAVRYTGARYAPDIVSERVILQISVRRLYKKMASPWASERSSEHA
jgi:PPOX class probable F420-dependent enzyme